MAHDIALALVGLGTAVTVAACLSALFMRSSAFDRMHFLTPITTIASPLVVAGLCVEQGWGLTAASYLLVGGLLFFSAPLLEAAMGRMLGQVEGKVPESSPE